MNSDGVCRATEKNGRMTAGLLVEMCRRVHGASAAVGRNVHLREPMRWEDVADKVRDLCIVGNPLATSHETCPMFTAYASGRSLSDCEDRVREAERLFRPMLVQHSA